MIKLPLQNRLGKSLAENRKSQGLTQAMLAEKASVSVPTVRQLEHGRGNLSSWNRVLDPMELEVVGRNLPPGEHLGIQIATLRNRKQLSCRSRLEREPLSRPLGASSAVARWDAK